MSAWVRWARWSDLDRSLMIAVAALGIVPLSLLAVGLAVIA